MKHNWEYKRLGDVCEILDSRRKPVTKSNRKPGPYPYYGASGIQDFVADYIFDGDYLLVGEDGAKWGANEKSAFSISGKTWVNNHAHILDFKNSPISQKLVEYILCGLDLNKIITGAVVPKLTQKNLISITIPVPPMETQEQIVAELDQINDLIAKNRELLSQLDALAQSLFYDTFGDPISNPKGWTKKSLANVCFITSSRRIFANEYCEYGIPFYRGKEISELSRGEKISIELFISPSRYEQLKASNNIPQVGDILITAVGTIGNIWVVDTLSPFYFKDGNIIWLKDVDFSVFNSKYFRFLLFRLIDIEKSKMANGSAYKALTIQNLKKLPVLLPPLALQEEFAAKVEAIEGQKAKVEAVIAELQTLLDARMDYWFN